MTAVSVSYLIHDADFLRSENKREGGGVEGGERDGKGREDGGGEGGREKRHVKRTAL